MKIGPLANSRLQIARQPGAHTGQRKRRPVLVR
jgi:hypothetical protein